jgi:hypothetical protein
MGAGFSTHETGHLPVDRARSAGLWCRLVVIWNYLVVEQVSSGWNVVGDAGLAIKKSNSLGEVLGAAGEKGWELAAASGPGSEGAVYIFKRPVDIGEDVSSDTD